MTFRDADGFLHAIINKRFDPCRPTHQTWCGLKVPTDGVLTGDASQAQCGKCRERRRKAHKDGE